MTISQLIHMLLDAYFILGTLPHDIPAFFAATAGSLLDDAALRSGTFVPTGSTANVLGTLLLMKPLGVSLALLLVVADE